MAGQLTVAAEKKALTHLFKTTPLYLGLSTQSYFDLETMTLAQIQEPTDTNYVRQSITFGNFVQEDNGTTLKNSASITFPSFAQSSTTIYSTFVTDGTDILVWYYLTYSFTPIVGQPIVIPINGLSISLE